MSHGVSIAQPVKLEAAWKRFFSPTNRYLSPLLISCVLLVGQLSYGILESYTRTLLAIVTSLVINRASQVNDCMSCRHWKGAQSVPASRYTALSAARVDVKPRSNTVGMCARYNKPWRVSNIASDPDYQRWHYIGHCGREAA